MRVVALLAAYNEERFIGDCLRNLIRQDVEVYLIDNSSDDRTVEIAEQYLKQGLIAIEKFPRDGIFRLKPLLERKEQLAETIKADWFMHVDADEIRLPPSGYSTLSEAFHAVESKGYNAVNFQEFTFIPVREEPDHDHSEFQTTMQWYYPFLPSFPHRLTAWKAQVYRVSLAHSGGHKVSFSDLRMYPESFPMRHYLFLSVSHLIRKYGNRKYDPAAVQKGWHRTRVNWVQFTPESVSLPSRTELRTYTSDDRLDASNPRKRHYLQELWKTVKRS